MCNAWRWVGGALARWRDRWVADDPCPELSQLDRWDGLTEPPLSL